ncbi:MAG: glutamine synthetase family protein [Candidatus Puniceispirillales bacterium]
MADFDFNSIARKWPDLSTVTAMFADSNGIMRGKVLPASGLEKLFKEGVFLPASVFGTDATGESVAETGLVWEKGDVDFRWMPVADTFFILPGSDGRDAAVMIQMMADDGSPHPLDPRSILQSVTCTLGQQNIFPVIAPELEFYLIGLTNDDRGMGQAAMVNGLGRGQETNQIYGIDSYEEFRPLLEAIKAACHAVSVGADTAITEYGRGQFEINLVHRDDPVRACDEAVLLRHLTRRVARQHGVDVTFMGKPFAEDTGSGFHLHASLWDRDGANILREPEGGEPWGNPAMAHAAGGMARYLGESMAVMAPNANAWRRIQPGHYAPTDRSWGFNNRTVTFRIPPGDAKARRLEHRSGSADVNPYLATALILGSMAEGLEQQITPPPMTTGNAYDAPQRDGLPDTWLEALDLFAESPFIGRWLGEEYRHVYAETKRYERRVFEGHITPLEWSWYR